MANKVFEVKSFPQSLKGFALVGGVSLVLAACSSGASDVSKPDMSVSAMEDLPNCTEKREGETALVSEDSSTYKCENGKWTFVSAPTPTVETLDDLFNCTAKVEGDTVKVEAESAIYRCADGQWKKFRALTDTLPGVDDLLACVTKREGNSTYITNEHALYACEDGVWKKKITYMDTVSSKDALPNCTDKNENDSSYVKKENAVYLCIAKSWRYLGDVSESADGLPNCTEKHEEEKAFVEEEHVTLICSNGKWYRYNIYSTIESDDVKSSSSAASDSKWEDYKPESSSSAKNSSSSKGAENSSSSKNVESSSSVEVSGHYDCSVYKCVTTEYLNQEMLAAGKYGELLDVRDSQVYRTVQIGEQVWMAQNLNFRYTQPTADEDSSSFCCEGDSTSCAKFGRLYMWSATMDSVGMYSENGKGCGYGLTCSPNNPVQGLCPMGWHVPDTSEWRVLTEYVGGYEVAGKKLKSLGKWFNDLNGTDNYGFSALPTGHYIYKGGCYDTYKSTDLWSSTDSDYYGAFYRYTYTKASDHGPYSEDYFIQDDRRKNTGRPVRCVKD